jgi:hypothetical protein
MKKTKRKKMSCQNGNIPTRQEFVLFDRKKHYSRMEKANMESWNLMILDEILYFEGGLKNQ